MSPENFQKAIKIISNSNNIKVSFNVPVNHSYSNVDQILIHNANAALVKELINAGFSLFIKENGVSLDHYN